MITVPTMANQLSAIAAEIARRTDQQRRAESTRSVLVELFGAALASSTIGRMHRMLDAISNGTCTAANMRARCLAADGTVINPSTSKSALVAMKRRGWIENTGRRANADLYSITPDGQHALSILRRCYLDEL